MEQGFITFKHKMLKKIWGPIIFGIERGEWRKRFNKEVQLGWYGSQIFKKAKELNDMDIYKRQAEEKYRKDKK